MSRPRAFVNSYWVALGDLLIINSALLVAYWARFEWGLAFTDHPRPPLPVYLQALAILDYCCLFLLVALGAYRRERFHSLIEEVNTLLKAFTTGLIFVLSLTFFVRDFEYSRLVGAYAWVLTVVGFVVFRWVLQGYERRQRARGAFRRRALIIGTNHMALHLATKFRESPELGFEVTGFLRSSSNGEVGDVLGTLGDFEEVLRREEVHAVFVADAELEHYRLLEIVELCENRGLLISLVPTIYDLLISFRDVQHLDGIPLVALEENVLSDISRAVKRVFDLGFSLFVLVLTLPLWPALALAIKLDSKGPVFYVQRRCGEGGRIFPMLKFRTMVRDADRKLPELLKVEELEEPVFKLPDDPRVTRVGRFLRRTSLDELPQFLNVLAGQMSVVGPRPEEVEMVRRYNVWQRRRLKMKPGITGLQQITSRGCASLGERVKYDIYYIRRQSLLLDLTIILRTIWVVLKGEGAT
jgi:exopolysaccharide biosynthesis polyprenyl glycosylphosphotransferase